MKAFLAALLLALVVGGAMLWSTFSAERLPVPADFAFKLPAAQPPPGMRIAVMHTGKMLSQAAFAYRGGAFGEAREFGMSAVLVQHPQGNLLFDGGFGRNVDRHVGTTPLLMRLTSQYVAERPAVEQLAAAGITPASLKGVILTHAHWDHVSGVEDLAPAPVWVTAPEFDFIRSGDVATALARGIDGIAWQTYEFNGGPYLGFDTSHDVFGDGSVVLVPTPGHTPGSIIAFIATPDGRRYALVGDLVWQAEGIGLPAERPWISRRLVDANEINVRKWIVHMHQIHRAFPDMVIVPAHDRRVAERLPGL